MNRIFIFFAVLLFNSCTYVHYKNSESEFYKTELLNDSDARTDSIISPYRQKMTLEMNQVVGKAAMELSKAQPESTLGNWAADAVKEQMEIYTGEKVDFALLNYGGLRIPVISAGDITKGKIFELMPFDNMLVLIKMKGSELSVLFDHICKKGGWPISSGLKMICGKDGAKVTINNQNIESERIYKIATIDYLAGGGDDCSFFISKKLKSTGVFLRDAVIENVAGKTKKGEEVKSAKEGRIIFEK